MWTGARNKRGYGILGLRGKHLLAHRAAYLLFVSEIPDGICVCHRCDKPWCVNVEHLFLGTIADNVHDMMAKLRSKHPHGEEHGIAKLTEADVLRARALYASGMKMRKISLEIGKVHRKTLARAIHGKTWATTSCREGRTSPPSRSVRPSRSSR